MKKLIYIACILFAINTNAQIAFEHTYDTASSIQNNIGGQYAQDELMMINFEVSGDRYVKVSRHEKKILIYNMNHALLKTINYSGFPTPMSGSNYAPNLANYLYFSQHLFNTDSLIEFMYCISTNSNAGYYTGIYNETGTLLFSDTGTAAIFANIPQQQYPIYNTTSSGTKMILSYQNAQAKVFSLGGTLTTAVDRTSHAFAGSMDNAYPNPTNSTTTIEYALPKGTNQGEVVFYNTQGIEVKRFKVDNTFSSLLISTADIPAGTYYYQLQTGGNASGIKKLVVIK